MVECTKGITRKCKNLVHDFFLSYFLTVSQYCMQTDLLFWSCSDCSVFFASQIIRGVAVRCTERALDALRERSIHQKRRTASCWRHWQLVPNITILSSWMRHITPSATPHPLPLPPKRRLSIARNTLMAPYGMRELFWAARALPPPLQI